MTEEGIFTSRESLVINFFYKYLSDVFIFLLQERQERKRQLERELVEERLRKEEEDRTKKELLVREQRLKELRETSQEKLKVAAASAIIIGNDLSNPDPVLTAPHYKLATI